MATSDTIVIVALAFSPVLYALVTRFPPKR
jgi:hypothetical protein